MKEKNERSSIITLSVPKIQDNFMKENKISPSKILQKEIAELMGSKQEVIILKNQIGEWQKKYAMALQNFSDFLALKQIDWNDFMRWKEEKK